jgi:levanase/fructan beta-fructosidase
MQDSTGNQVVVGYDAKKQILFVDCRNTRKKYKSSENLFQAAKLKSVKGKINVQILLDKSSLEVFGNDGRGVITTMTYPTSDERRISIFSVGNATLEHMHIWDLSKADKP